MTQTESAGGRPAYRQIADGLRTEIESGRRGIGSRLPSEDQLMDEHGVTRVTARRALAVLALDGLAGPERDRGWFVRRLPRARPTRLAHLIQASQDRERDLREFLEDVQQEIDRLAAVKRVLAGYPKDPVGLPEADLIDRLREIMREEK